MLVYKEMQLIPLSNNFDEAVHATVQTLREGGVVAMPMDTSYGLAADATNEAAVKAVLDLKGRAEAKTLSVVVRDQEMAERYAMLDEVAQKLWQRFMPGSLTVILPTNGEEPLPAPVASNLGLGLRQPDNQFTQAIANAFAMPFTATSANRSGQPPCWGISELRAQFAESPQPDLVIDGGNLPPGPSSTVVSLAPQLTVVRKGVISEQQICRALG